MKKSKLIISLTLLSLFASLARAATILPAWVQRHSSATNTMDEAIAVGVAINSCDEILVAGCSDHHYVTIKYSSAGVPVWTNCFNDTAPDYPSAIAVDHSNHVVVAGYSGFGGISLPDLITIQYSDSGEPLWTNRFIGLGGGDGHSPVLAIDKGNDILLAGIGPAGVTSIIKLTSSGIPVWTNYYAGPEPGDLPTPTGIVTDSSNSVVVTGKSADSHGFMDYFTIKYSGSGSALWTNRYDGPSGNDDQPAAVVVDNQNNVVVTGYSTGTSSHRDCLTIKYSSAGATRWIKRYSASVSGFDAEAYAVTVDAQDNVFIAGRSDESGRYDDYLTLKYSKEGVLLWKRAYNGTGNGEDVAVAVVLDAQGGPIVTGYSAGTDGPTTHYMYDLATVGYSSTGEQLWSSRYDSPAAGLDQPTAVALDHNGNVIVTGWSARTVSPYYYDDFLTLKYCLNPAPPIITGLRSDGSNLLFRVEEPAPASVVVIETSPNLAIWSGAYTNAVRTNFFWYSEPLSAPFRFYRVRLAP